MSDASVVRVLAAARACLGLLLVVVPRVVVRYVGGAAPPAAVVRVLGARLVAQAVVAATHPEPYVVGVGAAVDAVHGASMIAAALALPRYRRSALFSAATAFASMAAAGVIYRSIRTREGIAT